MSVSSAISVAAVAAATPGNRVQQLALCFERRVNLHVFADQLFTACNLSTQISEMFLDPLAERVNGDAR